MARLKVLDKPGLGRLVLTAAKDEAVRKKLIDDPRSMLMKFLENIPDGHVIKVVAEGESVTFVVLPAPGDVPATTQEKEDILREEAREYDETKKRVEESKQEGGQAGDKGAISPEVVEETFALMVGHSALSPSSRNRPTKHSLARVRTSPARFETPRREAAIPRSSSSLKHVLLKGSRRHHRAGAQVQGRANSHEFCEITVKLRRKEALPNPVPGKAVISRQAVANYGASDADMDTVARCFTGYGLTVVSKDPAARSIKLSGPVDKMEVVFNTHLFRVKHGDHQYRGRVGELSIPKEPEGIIQGVFGLDTRPMIKSRPRHFQSAPSRQLPPPDQRPWFLPQELAAVYNFPDSGAAGKTVGLIELGGQFVKSDLDQFVAIAGLDSAPNVHVVNVERLAPSDSSDPGAIGEVMLDIEVVAGACPGADIAVYFSNFTEKGWVDVIDAALNDTTNNPCVLSISYGLAEGAEIWTPQAMDAVNDAMKEAAGRGIPVCVAAGNDGSDDQVGDGLAHVNFPATSPFVLSIGGTALVRRAHGFEEQVWFDGNGLRKDQGGSTGGGVSAVFQRPAWQSSIDIPSVNPNGMSGRIVPDVAANAADSTGYFVIVQGQPQISGGTSAATPLWAALLARLIKADVPVNFITPVFYQQQQGRGGQTIGAMACGDITIGNNNTAAAGGYAARSGYDAVTGWGSPKGGALVEVLSTQAATV